MKKILFLLCVFVCTLFNIYAFEYEVPVCVTLNNNYINFENEPVLIDGTTYLPVRFFCEALSARVEWIDETKTVVVFFSDDEISFMIGESTALINGNPSQINGYARLINGRTYLPVRFIAEALGGNVKWDKKYYTAEISIDNITFPPGITGGRHYSNDEIYWLAKIISSESKDEPMKGKVAVGNVVLNRVKSDEYPNTIYSVIFDKKFGVQFQPVENGSIYNEAVQGAYLAAKLCLEGYNVVGECKYFLNPDKATNFWITQNKKYFSTIGSHDFYY